MLKYISISILCLSLQFLSFYSMVYQCSDILYRILTPYRKHCTIYDDQSDHLRMLPSQLIVGYIVATVLISDVQRRISELPLFFSLHIIADSAGQLTSDIHISLPSLSIINLCFPIHIYFVHLKHRYI